MRANRLPARLRARSVVVLAFVAVGMAASAGVPAANLAVDDGGIPLRNNLPGTPGGVHEDVHFAAPKFLPGTVPESVKMNGNQPPPGNFVPPTRGGSAAPAAGTRALTALAGTLPRLSNARVAGNGGAPNPARREAAKNSHDGRRQEPAGAAAHPIPFTDSPDLVAFVDDDFGAAAPSAASAVNSAATRKLGSQTVTSVYWCDSYLYSCGKGCYASAAYTCTIFDCLAGSSGTSYNSRANDCYSCPSGRYEPSVGQSSCRYTCPGGYYCPEGASNYTACPSGRYCPSGFNTAPYGNAGIPCAAAVWDAHS